MNHFARLGFEPRPWIDPELLKENFLRLSASAHPDKVERSEKRSSEKEFQELNASYNTLRNSRARWLHLLEISGRGQKEHVENVPPAAMELFPVVAAAIKSADTLIKEKGAAGSPMLKVQLMERGLDEIDRIQNLQARIQLAIQSVENHVKEIDARWVGSASGADLASIAGAAAALGFLERWKAQLQERVGALTF